MAKHVSPHYWKVKLNGTDFRRGFRSRREADLFAERWQGSHAGNRGLLKHKDRGDYLEVVRDHETERDTDERYDVAAQGSRQRILMHSVE